MGVTENAYLWFLQLGITRKMLTSPKGMIIHRRLPATRVGERIEKKIQSESQRKKMGPKKKQKKQKKGKSKREWKGKL